MIDTFDELQDDTESIMNAYDRITDRYDVSAAYLRARADGLRIDLDDHDDAASVFAALREQHQFISPDGMDQLGLFIDGHVQDERYRASFRYDWDRNRFSAFEAEPVTKYASPERSPDSLRRSIRMYFRL